MSRGPGSGGAAVALADEPWHYTKRGKFQGFCCRIGADGPVRFFGFGAGMVPLSVLISHGQACRRVIGALAAPPPPFSARQRASSSLRQLFERCWQAYCSCSFELLDLDARGGRSVSSARSSASSPSVCAWAPVMTFTATASHSCPRRLSRSTAQGLGPCSWNCASSHANKGP